MADYQKMYLQLFDAVECSLEIMDSNRDPAQKFCLVKALLAGAQQRCEDLYADAAER